MGKGLRRHPKGLPGPVQIGLCQSERRVQLARRFEDAVVAQDGVPDHVVLRIGMFCTAVVLNVMGREVDIEQGWIAADLMGDTRIIQRRALHVHQRLAQRAKAVILAGAAQDFHCLETRRRCDGIARERTQLHQPFLGSHSGLVEMRHDFRAGPKSGQGEATTDDLTKRADIGRDAIAFLRATIGKAKAGHDLVEDQQDAMLVTQIAQAL